MKDKRREEKRRGDQDGREEKRDERRDDFVEKCLKPKKKPPDELAQHVSRKIPFGRFFPIFPLKVPESYRVFNCLHDSILRTAGINSEIFFGRTVRRERSTGTTMKRRRGYLRNLRIDGRCKKCRTLPVKKGNVPKMAPSEAVKTRCARNRGRPCLPI